VVKVKKKHTETQMATAPGRSQVIMIYASDLAAAINRKKYESPEALMAKMFKRMNPAAFATAQARQQTRLISTDEVLSTVGLDVGEAASCATEAEVTKVATETLLEAPMSKVTAAAVKAVEEELAKATTVDEHRAILAAATLSKQQLAGTPAGQVTCPVAAAAVAASFTKLAHQAVVEKQAATPDQLAAHFGIVKVKDCGVAAAAVKSAVNCKRGNLREHQGIAQYEAAMNVKVVGSNDVFYKRKLQTSDSNCKCMLGGKVDGLVLNSDRRRVVEIKNRRSRFFATLPDYDYVQALAYMFLTSLDECDVVECFDGKIKITTVKFSATEWLDISEKAAQFAAQLHNVLVNPSLQDELLCSLADSGVCIN
jgi:hypothetical protein